MKPTFGIKPLFRKRDAKIVQKFNTRQKVSIDPMNVSVPAWNRSEPSSRGPKPQSKEDSSAEFVGWSFRQQTKGLAETGSCFQAILAKCRFKRKLRQEAHQWYARAPAACERVTWSKYSSINADHLPSAIEPRSASDCAAASKKKPSNSGGCHQPLCRECADRRSVK